MQYEMTNNQLGFEQFVEMIFKRYYLPLRAYAFRFVNNRDEADDVVQEVFLELVQKQKSLRLNEPNIKSYLFTSVYHRSLNHLNQLEKNRTLPLSDFNESNALDTYLSPLFKDQPQESLLLVDELSRAIDRCVDRFPPQCKKVFILSRSYQLKNSEIAQQLGISIKTVEKHLMKALGTLRNVLTKEGFYLLLYIINIL